MQHDAFNAIAAEGDDASPQARDAECHPSLLVGLGGAEVQRPHHALYIAHLLRDLLEVAADVLRNRRRIFR